MVRTEWFLNTDIDLLIVGSYFGLSMMEGGADTTAMFLQFFVLCMLANPDVKTRAQQEIDEVIGPNRSPELEDLDDLPYIRATINEVAAFQKLQY